MAGVDFAKGHGTQNDFVLLPDADDQLALTEARVRALCDRQRGLGADGVLRIVSTDHVPEFRTSDADWFMDYRNADGSIAEMCGNGVRVFARYLVDNGLAKPGRFEIATRAGLRGVQVHDDRTVTVDMGPARVLGRSEATLPNPVRPATAHPAPTHLDTTQPGAVGSAAVQPDVAQPDAAHLGAVGSGVASPGVAQPDVVDVGARWSGGALAGVVVDVGNPHLVCPIDAVGLNLDGLDLTVPPGHDPAVFPNGVNVEFVRTLGENAVRMRVHERGVGETRSCGTGTVAAVAATLYLAGRTSGEFTVDIPGGQVRVAITPETSTLTGPAVLLATGTLDEAWWANPA